MKILYKTTTQSFTNSILKREESSEDYEPVEIAYCCDTMKKAYNDGFIAFSGANRYPFSNIQTPAVCMTKMAWGEACDYLPIYNCPFCGDKIFLTEISRMKRIEKKRVIQKEEIFYEEVSA